MASNKKAQILAAVMCASSIFGSYTVVSAADTPATTISNNSANDINKDTAKVVASGNSSNGIITATAKNNSGETSTIRLNGNSLAIDVGKNGNSYDGTFTLNSKNLSVNAYGVTVKNTDGSKNIASLTNNTGLRIYDSNGTNYWGISNTGAITGTGLTVKGTGTSSIKAENATTGAYVKNEITSGTMTTTARGGKWPSESDNVNKTTSQVSATGVRDTVYDDGGNIKSTSVVDTNGVTLTSNRYDTGSKISSSLTIKGDSATLTSGSASVTLNNTTGNVAITANQKGSQGYVTLSGKNVKLDSNGLNIYDGTNTTPTATISKTGAITGTGLTVNNSNGTKSTLNSSGLIVNGTGTSSIKSTNSTTEAYVKNEISSAGMTTTARGGMYPSDADNKNKTTSQVSATGVRDTVYDDGGNIKSTSVVDTNGVTLTSNRYDTGSKISSSLTIKGDSATLTSGSASVTLNNTTGNVAITANQKGSQGYVTLSGKNVKLDSNGLNIYDGTNTTPTATISKTGAITGTGLTVNGTGTSSIKSTNSTTEAYVKNEISSAGMTTTARGGMYPSDADNKNKTTSQVSATGVRDTVYDDGGQIKATSSVTTSGIANTVNNSSITNTVNDVNTGKPLADSRLTTSGISNTTTDLAMTGTNAGKKMSTALYQNSNGISASATKKGEDGATIGTSTLTLGGDSASLKVGNYGFAVDNNNNVSINGKNASLGASGLSINNADGIKVGGISNTGYLMANDGMNVTDKNSSWVTIGTSTMKKDITATTTTSYAGITNKIDTTLAGKKTYTSGTVVGPTGVTTTVQGSNTTDEISGNKNKTTSTVSTTGVTDTVYNVKGNQVASSSVTTNGIVNTTTNLSIDGSTNNTMSTSISQNNRGISASATKKDENGTVGTSTLTLAGNSASLKVGNYGFAVDSNNNVSIAGNNATLYGSTFTLKDGSNNTARLTATGLSFTDASGQPIGGVSSTGAITGTSLNITAKNDSGNKTISKVDATSVTDTVYGTDGTTQVASSSVGINGISNNTNISGIAIKDDVNNTKRMTTSIAQNANGVNISSTKYNVYNDGTSKVQTTDGTSTISVNGAKTTISGYGNYEYKKDENGKLILDDKGNPIRSSNTSASLSVDGDTGTISLSGKNVGLGTNGLSLNKVNSDGTTTNYGTWNSNGLTVTATNTTGNKTTSQVSATGVTDAVYGTDGARVAYSNVGTGGITNSTNISGIAIKDDKNNTKTMNTSIAQNANGVSISSNKYNVYNDGTSKVQTIDGISTISVNGAKTTISGSGNYEYKKDENGKLILDDKGNPIRSSNTSASLSVDGDTGTISLSGKNVGLGTNGLSLNKVNSDGTTTNYGTWNSNGLTVTATNTTGNKTTSQVSATGTIDQVYDVDGKTRIAYSNITTTGITDSFTKDGITNSVTTNANGTTFSSTGNGSTTIKGDTIKTTNLIVNGKDIGGVATDVAGIDRNTKNEDGLGYYTQIEGKTKIYNTGRFSTANGNFVVDPYGSITSKAGNYRFNMDRTSGFDLGYAATTSFTLDNTGVSLGFRNNSFILDKNGATFINANGENVSFTSINGGTITTGETVINGSSITTKDLYVDNIHLNGAITDGNGNVVGGGDLSLGADGTLDLKYNANGITNTFVSGATGVHSSFSNGTTTASSSVGYIDDKNTIGIKDQVGNTSVTTTTDGTTFANGSGSTTINGGNITTTGDVTVGGDLSVGDNFKVDGTTGNVTGGTYNGVQISTDKDGNAIIGGTNIGDLATNEEVNKVNGKVDAVDKKVGDTSKLDKEITDNQNYKDNQNLVGAVNAEADIRRNEISRIDGQIEQLDGRVGSLENRMSDVEDRIDKVGAMSAAIANLRTMGYDPEAPTEIAIGVGQYKSETGLALGVFHYPNQDFMLSASISTSGDEVMGGIGATWKLGRKSAAEKAKDEEARRLEKAEEMKKLAQDAKVKAQAERHAKLLAEREAQKTA